MVDLRQADVDFYPEHHVLPSESSAARQLLHELRARLPALGYSDRDVQNISQALEEALVNAIRHGNRLDPKKKVEVFLRIDKEGFYVRIKDEGSGFDPRKVADPTRPDRLEMLGGRGLLMMRHYMCQVHFLDRGNVVVMCKRRPQAAVA